MVRQSAALVLIQQLYGSELWSLLERLSVSVGDSPMYGPLVEPCFGIRLALLL